MQGLGARVETTRTRCGPLPSWAPKINTFKKFQTLRFLFSKSRLRYYSFYCKNQNSRKYYGRIFVCWTEKLRYAGKKFGISGKLRICRETFLHSRKKYYVPWKILVYTEKIGDFPPPPRSPTIFGKNINMEPLFTAHEWTPSDVAHSLSFLRPQHVPEWMSHIHFPDNRSTNNR
jgi:hypothetical protein